MIDFNSLSNDQIIGLILFASFTLGWLTAQITKLILYLFRPSTPKHLTALLSALSASGGMPSGHSAATTALTLSLGLHYGFFSPLFIISACFTSIVIYDAINVRWAVGEHGKLLNQLTATNTSLSNQTNNTSAKNHIQPLTSPRLVLGHTLPEAIAGVTLGIIISLVLFFIFHLR